MDCIFCKIASGEIKSDIQYQDDEIIAFSDINPKAPTHLLIVPRKHIATVADLTEDETMLAGKLIAVSNQLARDRGITEKGYRLVINCGSDGGQEVPHLHLHLLGGRRMPSLG